MKKQFDKNYEEIISLENLFAAWQEFVRGKKNKKDVLEFKAGLTDNILQLHEELANLSYVHGGYQAFNISDPKPRHIHKATVRDRVLHHAVYRQLYPFFDRTFIADSYSCRLDKGVHRAIDRLEIFSLRASKNHNKTARVLKCDIKKFFASIDHVKLVEILNDYIPDKNTQRLLKTVIESFSSGPGKGLPLGNLTSQLFCNIYMNEFDQFIKHKLRIKNYIRYADDFVFLSDNKAVLTDLIPIIGKFLETNLCLSLHPQKVFIKTIASGLDFLGWINFPHARILRKTTEKRIFRRIREKPEKSTIQSYLGLISHGDAFELGQRIINWHGLWADKSY
jgi:retron-type reverse transcriptase